MTRPFDRPVDHHARERAATDLGTSIALSAGAGSGKTTVLTQRVLALLAAGVPPARIAAITFTEKAAGELQSRIRDALEERVAAGDELQSALAELPELTLSTIHSFCRGLLAAEALTAGWAPDTEILPDAIQADEVSAAFRTWEAGFLARHPQAGLLVRRLVAPRTLRGGAADLLTFRDLEPVVDVRGFRIEAAMDGLREVQARLEAAAQACTKPDVDKLLANNAALRAMLAEAVAGDAVRGVVRVLGSPETGNRQGGKQGDWVGNGKQGFLDAYQGFLDWRQGQLERLHGRLVADLREHFLPAVAMAKGQAAVGDYDDLLFRAAAVLADDGARRRLAARYQAILVDEVQDTDPIQAEVAALLTRDPAQSGGWDAHPPRPGRLFAVGDPRQSIYRFRRADVETWADLQRLVARDGAELTLTQNFRSVPGLVAWINDTFAPQLPGYVRQEAARGPGSLPPVVRLVTGEEGADELDGIARYLTSLKATGRVVDRETGELRPVGWSDVMVLLPSWSKAEGLQASLARAGIEALVEGGASFFERDEVRLALAVLRCLEEPADERSTVLVLRGLFGLTWEDLARHRAAGGAWRATVPDPPPGPVAEAYGVLRELARQRGRVPWGELLDALLERSRAASVWAALANGAARLANLDKLRALVRRVEAASRSPGDTLRRLGELTRDPEKDLSRNDLDSDAVRITSYFKAKGLEAPVVVLGFAVRKADSVRTAVRRGDRRVAVKISPLEPPDWATWEVAEKAALDAERRRWMYVAATRARDQLVFVDHGKLVDEHLAAGRATAEAVHAASLPEVAWQTATFPGQDAQIDGWLAEAPAAEPDPTEAWQATEATAIRAARAASTRWRSVLEIAARERVPRATSPVGVVGGRLVHEVMAALDLAEPADGLVAQVDGLVASFAAELAVDDEVAARCAEIVRGMLGHPIIAEARAAAERWTEVPFAIRDGDRVVSGRMDLAFPRDAARRTWVVVDWKSDVPPVGSPARRNYERQLALYAKALFATVAPCERVDTVLVGPYPELGATSAAEGALAEVLPELAEGLRRMLAEGVEVPRVGADVGEPIVAQAELAWDAPRVALLVGRPAEERRALEAQGWRVVAVDPVGPAWGEAALRAVRVGLGL